MQLTNASFRQVANAATRTWSRVGEACGGRILDREELPGRRYARLLFEPEVESGRGEVFVHQSWTESAYSEAITVVTYGNGKVFAKTFDDFQAAIAYLLEK